MRRYLKYTMPMIDMMVMIYTLLGGKLMYILLWLVFGGFVGWVASLLMEKNLKMGLFANIVVGIIGSALGMSLMELMNFGKPDTFSLPGFLVSVGGASLLLLIFSAFRKKL